MQAQITQDEGPGNGKQPGTGREASSCETIRTGAGGVEAEGRELEGAEAAEQEWAAVARDLLALG